MTTPSKGVICEVNVEPGKRLALPDSLVDQIGPGKYTIAVIPTDELTDRPTHDHSSFLRGYAPEDEGLYDDYPAGRPAPANGKRLTGYEAFLNSYGPEDEGLYDDCVPR